jgi:hypothetical protein
VKGLGSKSPTIARVAFDGAYQRRKKFSTSSTLAAWRSAIEPITAPWYGCGSGNSACHAFSSASPYGAVSMLCRRSFITTWRCVSRLAGVSLSRRKPIRSLSSQSAVSRWCDGTVSK